MFYFTSWVKSGIQRDPSLGPSLGTTILVGWSFYRTSKGGRLTGQRKDEAAGVRSFDHDDLTPLLVCNRFRHAVDLEHSLPWLALRLTSGLGARLAGKLLRQFGSPEEIFRASLTELEACQLPVAAAQAVFSKAAFRDAEKELAHLRKAGCRLIHWEESAYPKRLVEIYDPPPLLYVRGNEQVLNRHAISIVGTRRPTPYGNQIAERLARDLAGHGLIVVSGLARGIDSSAHRGACAASRGGTIGVLGSGIDVIYPKENRKLFEEVEKRGAIITELPMGTYPAPENFPVRNRMVAGLALGVVVVQGAQYSGSLITSRLAMEFGREVYGVPGNVTEPVSFAPNQLIKQGAKLVSGWEDVVEELPTEVRAELFPVEATTQEERASLFEENLSPIEKRLFDLIRIEEPIHVDELVETTGLSSSRRWPRCVKWRCAASSGRCRGSSLCAFCFSSEFCFR